MSYRYNERHLFPFIGIVFLSLWICSISTWNTVSRVKTSNVLWRLNEHVLSVARMNMSHTRLRGGQRCLVVLQSVPCYLTVSLKMCACPNGRFIRECMSGRFSDDAIRSRSLRLTSSDLQCTCIDIVAPWSLKDLLCINCELLRKRESRSAIATFRQQFPQSSIARI